MLKTRLDLYNDEWRTAQPETEEKVKIEMPIAPVPVAAAKPSTGIKVRKPRKRKGEAAEGSAPANATTKAAKHQLGRVKIMGKRKRMKSDKVCYSVFSMDDCWSSLDKNILFVCLEL